MSETLVCAICLYVPETPHEAKSAVTVIDGLAVCDDHLGYVSHRAIQSALGEELRRHPNQEEES